MAEIKMSYIFIEKKKHEEKTLQTILLEIISSIANEKNDKTFKIQDIDVDYRIIQKKNADTCYLELISKARVNKAVSALGAIDDVIFTSSQQQYFYSMRNYDGISESFCKRLYPKYAEFERNIRSLILYILTKAYGSNWRKETVSEELYDTLKRNAHGNLTLNEVLENMDLHTLETYLFEKRRVDYPRIINDKLSSVRLKQLEKEELCAIIEEMRPTSLWEDLFDELGSGEEWKNKIEEIHDLRNKVAHHKTISLDEFRITCKKLNLINKELSIAIEGIRNENFTECGSIDILESFTRILSMSKNIMMSLDISGILSAFTARIQDICYNSMSMNELTVRMCAESLCDMAKEGLKNTNGFWDVYGDDGSTSEK